MKKENNLLSAIIIGAIIIAGSLIYLGSQITKSKTPVDIEAGIEAYIAKQQEEAVKAQADANKPKFIEGDFTDDDPVLGDKNAPITLIEWSDYECPFCKRHFTQTLPLLKEKYIDTGKLKLVFRDFPLQFHDPLATQQAMAAECVREQSNDEVYFAYHDLIFQTTKSNGQGMKKEQLYGLAEDVGVDKAKFTNCLDSEKYKNEVLKDISDGQSIGINGTPGFLLNGQLISGALPFAEFEKIIEKALADVANN